MTNWTSTTILVKLDCARRIGMYLRVQEETGAALINRGVFVAPGTQPPPGQRRLYLAIEGQDARAVALAKAEMKRVLNEETLNLAAGGRGRSRRWRTTVIAFRYSCGLIWLHFGTFVAILSLLGGLGELARLRH